MCEALFFHLFADRPPQPPFPWDTSSDDHLRPSLLVASALLKRVHDSKPLLAKAHREVLKTRENDLLILCLALDEGGLEGNLQRGLLRETRSSQPWTGCEAFGDQRHLAGEGRTGCKDLKGEETMACSGVSFFSFLSLSHLNTDPDLSRLICRSVKSFATARRVRRSLSFRRQVSRPKPTRLLSSFARLLAQNTKNPTGRSTSRSASGRVGI